MPPQCWTLDTWKLTACTELQYENGNPATVTLKLVTDDSGWVVLRLLNVTTLALPVLSPHLWLQELEISHVRSRGWDGVAFAVESAKSDGGELKCYCESIEYVASSWP